MATPYDESQVMAFIADCHTAYAAAGQSTDPAAGVWPARMQFDAVDLGYPVARSKQLTALQTALGAPAPEPGPEPVPPGPFTPAPRVWAGNMCGVRVAGIPSVPGGARMSRFNRRKSAEPALVLSWLYDRYAPADRATIRAAWKARGYTHIVLSWPDARAFHSPQSFRDIVVELITDGFFPCVFWCSKDFDPPDVDEILAGIEPALALLVGVIPLTCIGWELSLWLTPTDVQQLIDAIAPRFTPSGCRVYVHFQQGYGSFQQDGGFVADFWKLQVGKLTGLLHQRILGTTPEEYRGASGGLVDMLQRFAGNFFVPPDSGFGHPFDLVAWEITAMDQFSGTCTERTGDTFGTWAIETPGQSGPAGVVTVMGSGNGHRA
jgi:hypothetical protein